MTKQEIALTPVFQSDETVAYYKPTIAKMAKDGKPFREGGRVITRIIGKEFKVIYGTYHENPEIQSFYEEFKMTDNKVFWLQQNAHRLKNFDINTDKLLEAWKDS